MPKRVVDTRFWNDTDVLDTFSVEDKYFYLYLMTNPKCSQLGIYSLPKKVIAFETGYSAEAITVLLDRFENVYHSIAYSKTTQEISLLSSLKYSLLKGGKPVLDLLEKEFNFVRDADLIKLTYDKMSAYWEQSKRSVDKSVKNLFESELASRGFAEYQIQNQNSQQDVKQINSIQNQNHNHNQESSNDSSTDPLRAYANKIKVKHPSPAYIKDYLAMLQSKDSYYLGIDSEELFLVKSYQQKIQPVDDTQVLKLNEWLESMSVFHLIDAICKSAQAHHPDKYLDKIISNTMSYS